MCQNGALVARKTSQMVLERGVDYIRTSTEKQEDSPEAQRMSIEQWASSNDVEMVAWHVEQISMLGHITGPAFAPAAACSGFGTALKLAVNTFSSPRLPH